MKKERRKKLIIKDLSFFSSPFYVFMLESKENVGKKTQIKERNY